MVTLAINKGEMAAPKGITERYQNVTKEDRRKIDKYLKEGDLSIIDGGVMTEFEKEFAKFVGAKYAVSYCNGTAALHAASYACGADKDSTFISSVYSYHGTILSLLENNSKVILVDFEDNYLTIDLDSLEANMSKKIKGIIVTHCWGNLVDYDRLKKIKEKYNVRIIVDASHAHGAKYKGKRVGGISCEDITCFSLGKNKLMSAGELGVAVTNDKELYQRLLFIGHPNRVPDALDKNSELRKYSNGIGNKYRPHALSLVLGLEQIKRFPKKLEMNQKTNEYLSNEINKIEGFYTPQVHKNCTRTYWKLHIFLDEKYWKGISVETIADALRAEGLRLEQFHNYDIKEQLKIWTNERYKGQVENKSTKKSPKNVIVLPGYIDISKKDKDSIVEAFRKVSENKEKLK